jgi:hemerythrin
LEAKDTRKHQSKKIKLALAELLAMIPSFFTTEAAVQADVLSNIYYYVKNS